VDLGLAGRRALVTGGSKGIGLAIAEEVEAAAARLREGGATIHAQRADVTDPDDVRAFVARSAEALGGIDFLVNNAGRAHPGQFATLDDDHWQADLDVKLFSLIRCSREVLPHMREAGGGRIVNVGAVYARMPDPTFFATSVNRAAGLSFTKALAMEVAKDNVLVNAVNIGFVVTPQWESIRRRRAPELPPDEFFARMAAREVPLGRFGTTEEVSGLVAFLLSPRASYITGASIDVAGGMGRYV
jgi:3-oxoacyl-[acyl-carrier protein] reductase